MLGAPQFDALDIFPDCSAERLTRFDHLLGQSLELRPGLLIAVNAGAPKVAEEFGPEPRCAWVEAVGFDTLDSSVQLAVDRQVRPKSTKRPLALLGGVPDGLVGMDVGHEGRGTQRFVEHEDHPIVRFQRAREGSRW